MPGPYKLIGQDGHLTITELPDTPDFSAVTGVTFPLVIPVTAWTGDVQSELKNVTDTAAGGWQALIGGIKKGVFTFAGFWDAGQGAVTLATLLAPGRPVEVTLRLGKYKVTGGGTPTTAAPYAIAATIVVGSLKFTNDAKEAITFECSGESTGPVVLA